jgi:hypothetical protein
MKEQRLDREMAIKECLPSGPKPSGSMQRMQSVEEEDDDDDIDEDEEDSRSCKFNPLNQ